MIFAGRTVIKIDGNQMQINIEPGVSFRVDRKGAKALIAAEKKYIAEIDKLLSEEEKRRILERIKRNRKDMESAITENTEKISTIKTLEKDIESKLPGTVSE